MTVFRVIRKLDWSWPTRLAPLLHEITFCLGLSYVKGGAILGHNKHVPSMKTKCQVPLFQSINRFSSSATNISIYHILMITPQALRIFTPCSPWHNLQQFKYSNKSRVYIFLTGLCANWFCTVWPVLLVRVRVKMRKVKDLACQYARCIYSKQKKKHPDVYYQDSNYNCLYLLYYTYNKHCNQLGLLLTVLQDTMPTIHTMCV